MHLCESEKVPYYKFSLFESFPEIRHGLFTRHGGYSKHSFSTLNAGLNSGDDIETVRKNRDLILKTIGGRKLISVRQVHEADVLVLSEKNGDVNKTESLNPVEADAIITDITGLTLLILVADCQPVLLYDFTNKVVANIHSGWRGSVLNIIGKTVDAMAENFGTSPEDVVAGIGPSLGPCCAEFTHYRKEIPNDYWKYKNDLDHFDFWAISRDQLLLKGVKKENIVTGNICTKCNTDTFYSYRKEKTTGRLACTIGLK